jgi:multiple sugar transport system ATP-binding protein
VADIVLDAVTKRYPDGALAVQEMNIEIADGEFVILVGPSGCGKSTTLNMIAGLEDISSGQLRIGGEVMNNRAPKDRDIAMVFQNYALYPHMTVRENMGFPLTLAKVDKETIRRKVDDAAEVLELTQHLERKPSNLSGGQRQRVAMGRAIVRDPKAFLMDEPLSNLDAKLRVQMRTEVSRLQKRLGTTTVYVTHDQTEAMTLGDRVVVMRGGIVQQVGTPQQLYDSPANLFVAGFIGSPAMNFLPASIEAGRLHTPLGDVAMTDRQRAAVEQHNVGHDVILGVRPEHFEDLALVRQNRDAGGTFSATIDLVESMGSDVYAYFDIADASIDAEDLPDEADADAVKSSDQIVARLDPQTSAAEGRPLQMWFDASKIHIFDPSTGQNVTASQRGQPELTESLYSELDPRHGEEPQPA